MMPIMASSLSSSALALPLKTIPGGYGPPVIGPLKDRLDYFWFQGTETFFRHRAATHKSTVFRTNMPPTFPFFLGVNPRVIAVVDCAAFQALFDLTLVDKRDVLVGDYMPSTSFTGGLRPGVYMDTSEPKHAAAKAFALDLLKQSAGLWVSEFLRNTDVMLTGIEKELAASSSGSAGFIFPLQKCLFAFLCKSIARADPAAWPEVGERGFLMLDKWLSLQLLPTISIGVLQPLEEIFLHSFAYPFLLVKGGYQKLQRFVEKEGAEVIQMAADGCGLSKEEAVHNILFVLGFNAFGGFSIFLPRLMSTVGGDGTPGLQDRLRAEVRRVLAGGRPLGFDTVREMELVRSTVHEVLRMHPPVFLQYGRARKDFVLNSHDAAYQVRQGELLCGYQALAMRDPRVFDDPETFVPERFTGEKGRRLLDYLYWSNGPETGTPTIANKQCAAKDYVVATACMLVAEILRRYDDFRCDSISVTKLEKAKTGAEAEPAAASST